MKQERSRSDSGPVGQSVNQSVKQCRVAGTVIVDRGGGEGRPQERRSRAGRMGMGSGFRHWPCHLSLATILPQKPTGGSGGGWVTWRSSPAASGCLLFCGRVPTRAVYTHFHHNVFWQYLRASSVLLLMLHDQICLCGFSSGE